MTPLAVLVAGVLLAMAGTELALGGRKVQSRLGLAVAIFLAVGTATTWYVSRALNAGPVPCGIFWIGAFLSWFGVRSHVESSILLRMLYLLRRGPLAEAALLEAYEAHYGGARRAEELVNAGLVRREGHEPRLTPRGQLVLRIVSWLT